jgi:hypothetical protein
MRAVRKTGLPQPVVARPLRVENVTVTTRNHGVSRFS